MIRLFVVCIRECLSERSNSVFDDCLRFLMPMEELYFIGVEIYFQYLLIMLHY
jgi:hypothetical protein